MRVFLRVFELCSHGKDGFPIFPFINCLQYSPTGHRVSGGKERGLADKV